MSCMWRTAAGHGVNMHVDGVHDGGTLEHWNKWKPSRSTQERF